MALIKITDVKDSLPPIVKITVGKRSVLTKVLSTSKIFK